MKFKSLGIIVLALAFLCVLNTASADTNYSFYYQSIEDVKPINEDVSQSAGWWAKAKNAVKGAVNGVKRFYTENISRQLGIKEGEATWYSDANKNAAYKVNRIKITSEEQLLKAMNAETEDELTSEQKEILKAFRYLSSDSMAERAKYGKYKNVNILLTDPTPLSLEEKDGLTMQDVRKDFWSFSNGSFVNVYASSHAVSTMVHETCHSMDSCVKELVDKTTNPYGLDGDHYVNELSNTGAAFVEGWAEGNEMIDFEDRAKYYMSYLDTVAIESKTVPGSYSYVPASTLSGDDLLKLEMYNATIIYKLGTQIENGRAKLFKAFKASNSPLRSLKGLIRKYCKQNPNDVAAVAAILDETTLGKLSDETLLKHLGKSPAALKYVADRKAAREAEKAAKAAAENDKQCSEPKNSVTTPANEIKLKHHKKSSNPFAL